MPRNKLKEFYGDETRWFIGTVVNHVPPHGMEGRVKVRIHGVHSHLTSEVPEADLPWAQTLIPCTEEGVSGEGNGPKLCTGALVFGMFMDGKDSQVPVVFGSIPHVEAPSVVQEVNKLDINKNSFAYSYTRLLPSQVSDSMTNPAEQRLRRRSEGMKFFIDSGYTLEQSAGIVGNLDYQSRLIPGGNGIANWSAFRLNSLKNFAADLGSDAWDAYGIQLQFVLYELSSTKTIANSKLLATNAITDSVVTIHKYYINNLDDSVVSTIMGLALTAYDETVRS